MNHKLTYEHPSADVLLLTNESCLCQSNSIKNLFYDPDDIGGEFD